ncbi:MAG TPA: glycosyltransferase family 4 protein [Bacteroidia bacterium]|jgi:glycosyltransferase involved in cell wall biosynthesis|nr:glycosyltransferase family 4 protein [Bacteroidia bacterium]
MHVVHVIANNSTVPYLNWFAEGLRNYPDVKFSVVAMYPEKPHLIEEMKAFGCDAYWIKFDAAKRKSGMISSFFKLYKLFKQLKPDVLNAHLFDDSVPALLAARFAGIKKRVIRKQDTAFHWYFKPLWVWVDRFNNVNSTDIIAISKDSEKFLLEKEKAPARKMRMIHNGIPIKDFTTQVDADKEMLVKKYGLEGKTVLGTIARYIEWKGYKYIIEAARELTRKNKNLKFLFVGHGEQQNELEDLVNKYGLSEYIVFTGWIDRKYIPSLYGIMDVYIHAAVMEPFGFVLVEAMANGVAIVTSKTGVAADALIHMETCYFTGDKDPEGIAEGVQWMLENPTERNAMKDRVRKLAADLFSVEHMLDEHIKVYRGIK